MIGDALGDAYQHAADQVSFVSSSAGHRHVEGE